MLTNFGWVLVHTATYPLVKNSENISLFKKKARRQTDQTGPKEEPITGMMSSTPCAPYQTHKGEIPLWKRIAEIYGYVGTDNSCGTPHLYWQPVFWVRVPGGRKLMRRDLEIHECTQPDNTVIRYTARAEPLINSLVADIEVFRYPGLVTPSQDFRDVVHCLFHYKRVYKYFLKYQEILNSSIGSISSYACNIWL